MPADKPLQDSSRAAEFEEAVGGLSPAEERFENWRRTIGLFAGPIVFVTVWLLPFSGLSPEAHRLAAVVSLVVVWWVTEAIPIPAAAVIGTCLTVVFGITSASSAFAPFASPIIFLFMGSFMLGRAVAEHGLDRRLAYSLLSLAWVRGSLTRLAVAVLALTMLISGWMSNTATTAMLLPVALGILTTSGVTRGPAGRSRASVFLISIAYAASIGGVATPVGSPPNLITLGLVERIAGIDVTFFAWMAIAVPIGATLGLVLMVVTGRRLAGVNLDRDADSALGPDRPVGRLSPGERNAALAFGLAVLLWVTPGLVALVASTESPVYRLLSSRMEESVVAIGAAGLLFLLPVDWRARRFTLDWTTASRIDWGTLLLFGGGLSLGGLMFETGLASHIGTTLVDLSGARSLWAVTAMSILLGIVLTEITSNTAATNMLVPVVLSICQAANLHPVPPALGVALGASMAFMLPISTPPNAIVYGSGLVPVTTMIRMGIVMDLVAFGVILAGLRLLCPLFGFT